MIETEAQRRRVVDEGLADSEAAFDEDLRRRGVARQRALVVEAAVCVVFNLVFFLPFHIDVARQSGWPDPVFAMGLAPMALVSIVLCVLGFAEDEQTLWKGVALMLLPVNLLTLAYGALNVVVYALT